MKTPIYCPLVWEPTLNDDHNTIWEAESPILVDGGLAVWRLSPFLRNDRVEYKDDSDLDLRIGVDRNDWETLEDGKASLEARNRKLWEEAVASGEIVNNPGND